MTYEAKLKSITERSSKGHETYSSLLVVRYDFSDEVAPMEYKKVRGRIYPKNNTGAPWALRALVLGHNGGGYDLRGNNNPEFEKRTSCFKSGDKKVWLKRGSKESELSLKVKMSIGRRASSFDDFFDLEAIHRFVLKGDKKIIFDLMGKNKA